MYDDSIKEYKTDIEINVIKWIESYWLLFFTIFWRDSDIHLMTC